MMYKAKVLFSLKAHKTHKCNVISMQNFSLLNLEVRTVTGRP